MSKLQVEGYSNYVRDTKTGAILNTNSTVIQNAIARKAEWKKKQEEHENLVDDVDELKQEIKEIKNLLGKIAEKL